MQFVDTHTHLFASEFESDIADVIESAKVLGVSRFFLPNIDSASIAPMLKLCRDYPGNCFPMMGLHPCSINEHYEEELRVVDYWLEKSSEKRDAPAFYAVGEIGIDLYWDKTFFVQQKVAFIKQIELAKKYKLPIVIHTRNSFEETFSIVKQLNDENLRGIFHCFSGSKEDAEKIISLGGFKMGIGGVLTFKNSGLDKVVGDIPLEYLVLETDSPYLAPVPYRGKRNESKYVVMVAQKLSEIKKIPIEEIAAKTTKNALDVFNVK